MKRGIDNQPQAHAPIMAKRRCISDQIDETVRTLNLATSRLALLTPEQCVRQIAAIMKNYNALTAAAVPYQPAQRARMALGVAEQIRQRGGVECDEDAMLDQLEQIKQVLCLSDHSDMASPQRPIAVVKPKMREPTLSAPVLGEHGDNNYWLDIYGAQN